MCLRFIKQDAVESVSTQIERGHGQILRRPDRKYCMTCLTALALITICRALIVNR